MPTLLMPLPLLRVWEWGREVPRCSLGTTTPVLIRIRCIMVTRARLCPWPSPTPMASPAAAGVRARVQATAAAGVGGHALGTQPPSQLHLCCTTHASLNPLSHLLWLTPQPQPQPDTPHPHPHHPPPPPPQSPSSSASAPTAPRTSPPPGRQSPPPWSWAPLRFKQCRRQICQWRHWRAALGSPRRNLPCPLASRSFSDWDRDGSVSWYERCITSGSVVGQGTHVWWFQTHHSRPLLSRDSLCTPFGKAWLRPRPSGQQPQGRPAPGPARHWPISSFFPLPTRRVRAQQCRTA